MEATSGQTLTFKCQPVDLSTPLDSVLSSGAGLVIPKSVLAAQGTVWVKQRLHRSEAASKQQDVLDFGFLFAFTAVLTLTLSKLDI